MMRSLFSGVSGLKNHQTRMDVIGNNISNVNTTGFKSSRVTFTDMLSQNLTGAAAPSDNRGGTNPKQIGLGSSVAAIDLLFTNGSVQSTGKNTDLCISGNALFQVKDNSGTYYTRNGAFEFDADGNYVLPGSGLFVQGWMAKDGELTTTGDTTNIVIPAGKSMASEATKTATYTNNLNSEIVGYEIANILVTYEDGTSKSLQGYPSGTMQLTLSGGLGTVTLDETADYDFTTNDYVKNHRLYTTQIESVAPDGTGKEVDLVLNPGKSIFSISTWNSVSSKYEDGYTAKNIATGSYAIGEKSTITGTILTNGVTTSGSEPGQTTLTVKLSTPSTDTVQIKVPSPEGFTYKDGQTVSFDLEIGQIDAKAGAKVNTSDGKNYTICAKDIDSSKDVDDTTTEKLKVKENKQDYAYYGRTADGQVTAISRLEEQAKSVSIVTKDGQTLNGLPGQTYNVGETFYPSVVSTITIYDSLGSAHDVAVMLTKTAKNEWSLSLKNGTNKDTITESDGSVTEIELTSEKLKFKENGAYDSGSASLQMKYKNGAADQKLQISLGGLTQYAGSSTVSASADGYAAGNLSSISIDTSGIITGTYTNGEKRAEAQVAVAQFNNASGLTKTGDSLYQESNNSGVANVKTAADLGVTITPSALEMSNVDVANEFTDMIITQRGFQGNSKIITVSDEMLETLINMKR